MSKVEHGTAVPCSTIANLTERSDTAVATATEGITPPAGGLLRPIATAVAAYSFATWYSAFGSYFTLSGGTSSEAGLFSARTISAKKPA